MDDLDKVIWPLIAAIVVVVLSLVASFARMLSH